MPFSNPTGVHFVGSIPLKSADDVFQTVSSTLPHHLKAIPDGETGDRSNFVVFQKDSFPPEFVDDLFAGSLRGSWDFKVVDRVPDAQVPGRVGNIETGYDTHAIESYGHFAKLRDTGVIPKGVRFQVAIPTPINTVNMVIAQPYRPVIYPLYQTALQKAIRKIQDSIPHEDLAIQIDLAIDIGILEGIHKRENAYNIGLEHAPWWQDEYNGTIDMVVEFIKGACIDDDVLLGAHLCYGDMGHKHNIDPTDSTILADVISNLARRCGRKLDYAQFPVPIHRVDAAYLEPMKAIIPVIKESGTHIYVGLIHPKDLDGNKTRIATAKETLGDEISWGVSSECGLGREAPENIADILNASKTLSKPWQTLQPPPS